MSNLTIKRGDTFPIAGVLTIRDAAGVDVSADTDFSTWSISSQLRAGPKADSALVATANVAFTNGTNSFAGEVAAADTGSLPDTVYLDLRFKDAAGKIMSTKTVKLNAEDAISESP